MKDQVSIFSKNRMFFEEFLRKTNQKKNIKNFLIKNFPVKSKKIKILSIGAGSGEEIIIFLKYLKSKKIDFEFFYLDSSKPSFNIFKEKIEKLSLSKYISHIEFKKFEVFQTKEKFDMIVASHVFYYIKNWEKSLNKLYTLLKNKGRAFLFIQSKYSDNFKFRNKILKSILGKNYNEKFGEELIETVEKLDLNYKSQKIMSKLDITKIFLKNNKISYRGKLLLSFLLRTNFDRLDNKIKLNIIEYIIKNSRINGKQKKFKLIDNYIVIYK